MQVVEFLSSLHHGGLQHSTIADYRLAIGVIHLGFSGVFSVSNNPMIHRILVGSFILCPTQSKLVPSWSLSLVFKALEKTPYEHLHKATFEHFTSVSSHYLFPWVSCSHGFHILINIYVVHSVTTIPCDV